MEKARKLFDSALKNSVGGRIDEKSGLQYNKKSLINKPFPNYNEAFSEANERAMRWAKRTDVETGDKALISFNDEWYIIEKFADMSYGYLIMAKVAEKDYHRYKEEIENYGKHRELQTIQGSYGRYGVVDKSSNTDRGVKSNINSSPTEHSGENSEMVRVASTEDSRRERTQRDGSGDSESSGSNRQGDYLSKKDLQFSKKFERAPKNYKLYGIDEKYFSQKESRQIVLDVVAEKLNIDEFSGEIDSGNLAEVAQKVYKIFNERKKGENTAVFID